MRKSSKSKDTNKYSQQGINDYVQRAGGMSLAAGKCASEMYANKTCVNSVCINVTCRKGYSEDYQQRFRRASSLLEMLVTLIIVAMVSVAVLKLLNQTTKGINKLTSRMNNLGAIESSLDMLAEDVMVTAQSNGKISVEHGSFNGQTTAHVIITPTQYSGRADIGNQIDWVSVPRYEQKDLVLFRREQTPGQGKQARYIPLCENLSSFDVQITKDVQEQTAVADPNAPTAKLQSPLVKITAQVFRDNSHDPDNVITVTKTFCLKRFY